MMTSAQSDERLDYQAAAELFDWAKQVVDHIAEPPAKLMSNTYDRRP